LGLAKIFIFSALSGISFAFSLATSGDTSNVGFSFVLIEMLSQHGDSQIQALVTVASIIVTIIFIYGLSRLVYQIYEERLAGILTAVLGFTGSFIILFTSQQQSYFIFLGIGLLVGGAFIIFLGRK
jgi:hypothetical protein